MALSSPSLNVFFKLSIDAEFDLGVWTSITGLGMALETKPMGDAGMSFFEHKIPGHVKYTDIVLKRPVYSSSGNVLNWISAYHMAPIPTVGEIAAIDQSGTTIVSWQMIGVSPVSWKGPDFDANAALSVPTETLEIAHQGFL